MLIKYVGGRNNYKTAQDRSRVYIFNPENNFTLDLKMDEINYIIGLQDNRGKFIILEKEQVEEQKKPVLSTKKGAKNVQDEF